MISTALLAESESAASWVSAIGQWVGAVGAITVAVVALRWERQMRRDQEKAQAALVIIEVGHSTGVYRGNNDLRSVTITNHSNRPVQRPQIESMGDVRPPARWGWGQLHLTDQDGKKYVLGTDELILPHASARVPYQQDSLDPRMDNFFNDNAEYVRVNDVTITFGMSGVRWRRTGHGEPVQIGQQASTQPLRAKAAPFVANWISRIRRRTGSSDPAPATGAGAPQETTTAATAPHRGR